MGLLVVGGAVARAQEGPTLREIERDLASIDSGTRAAAVTYLAISSASASDRARLLRRASRDATSTAREAAFRALTAAALGHQADAIGAFVDGLCDPEPAICRIAREGIVALGPEHVEHVSVDRIVRALAQARDETEVSFRPVARDSRGRPGQGSPRPAAAGRR